MNFRTATLDDVPQLAAARFAFRTEGGSEVPLETEQAFVHRYEEFVRDAFQSRRWTYWIAETVDGEIASHMAVCVVQSIPRPSRMSDESERFYARAGFGRDEEIRVLRLRDYDAPMDSSSAGVRAV